MGRSNDSTSISRSRRRSRSRSHSRSYPRSRSPRYRHTDRRTGSRSNYSKTYHRRERSPYRSTNRSRYKRSSRSQSRSPSRSHVRSRRTSYRNRRSRSSSSRSSISSSSTTSSRSRSNSKEYSPKRKDNEDQVIETPPKENKEKNVNDTNSKSNDDAGRPKKHNTEESNKLSPSVQDIENVALDAMGKRKYEARERSLSPTTVHIPERSPPKKRMKRNSTSNDGSASDSSEPKERRKRDSSSRRDRHRRKRKSGSDSKSEDSSGSDMSMDNYKRHAKRKEHNGRRNDQRQRSISPRNSERESSKVEKGVQEDVKDVPKPNVLLTDPKLSGRTGGIYIPPFKLAQMRKEEEVDESSPAFQRKSWDALRKSLNGLINKVNASNLAAIVPEFFQENLVRGRGLLARSIMKAQLASPGFTHIYAALLAVLNTKLPEAGELIVRRVVLRFRKAYKRGDKVVAIALVRFIAHMVNQQIVHELLALEVLTLLLTSPTDDSVEVAVNFTKECGQILAELCPEGLRAIFERFRGILHEGEIDKRVQYTIEGLFAIRKGGFADYPAIHPQLDLVESGDQITHETTLEEEIDSEDKLDVFRFDPDFAKNELMWKEIKKEILGDSDSESGSSDAESDDANEGDDEHEDVNERNGNGTAIQDFTEQDQVNLRRTIYLTIMSSLTHEECGHKLMKLNIRPGQEGEICAMLIECCSQERTYLRYYGLLGQRFCLLKREYQDAFDACFAEQYSLIHRLETNKLRNVAKFFAHLLFSDALPWTVFEYIRLNEEDTTSSSRIFIKILCQELSEHMGLNSLKERFFDPLMEQTFAGLFPKDNPRNTRFAINFFTSIGLGGLTKELREYLKLAPKIALKETSHSQSDSSSSSGSDSDSDSNSDSSSGSSGSGSSSSSSSLSSSSSTSRSSASSDSE